MENLAPAGSMEALERAVAAGADAVYLGYAAFSARAGAGNFDSAQLAQAVDYCHLHGVRVHVTVNTLIKDGELAEVGEVLSLLNRLRVDGVLVQDLAVADMLRTRFPDLPVHASTQMALHNVSGVRFARTLGCVRVVLARECGLDMIRDAAREGLEIEVFGHGAQCVGVSGECLFSSMLGERSGNRGRCAQPCRLPYTYRGKTAAWLSPRDVCLRDDLPALAGAGVASVKLEGRLKRPEYVAVTAASYRKAIDSLENGHFAKAGADERLALRQMFNRGDFMRGYAMGAEDAAVIYPQRVNHLGVPLGKIERVERGFARFTPLLALHDGDGLQLRAEGTPDQDMIYSGKEIPAGQEALLRLRPDMRVRPGMLVCRLTDARQMAQAAALPEPSIAVDMRLTAFPGQPLTLWLSDGESAVTVTGPEAQQARSRALTAEDAARCLEKTGDTCFIARNISVETADAFAAVSVLNALRREGLEALRRARIAAHTRQVGRKLPDRAYEIPAAPQPPTALCRTPAQLDALPQGVRALYQPEIYTEDSLCAALTALNRPVWLCLPTVCGDAALDMLAGLAGRFPDKLLGYVLGSVGQLGHPWPLPVAAGPGIPVMNRRAMAVLLEMGCAFVTASPELSARETAALIAGDAPALVWAYGRVRLMLLHHCPARVYLGLHTGHAACRMCDDHAPDALAGQVFTDRRGERFPLLRQRLPEGCRVELLNALPTDLRRQVSELGAAPLNVFTLEDARETAAVLAGQPCAEKTTTGHWNRPVT